MYIVIDKDNADYRVVNDEKVAENLIKEWVDEYEISPEQISVFKIEKECEFTVKTKVKIS